MPRDQLTNLRVHTYREISSHMLIVEGHMSGQMLQHVSTLKLIKSKHPLLHISSTYTHHFTPPFFQNLDKARTKEKNQIIINHTHNQSLTNM